MNRSLVSTLNRWIQLRAFTDFAKGRLTMKLFTGSAGVLIAASTTTAGAIPIASWNFSSNLLASSSDANVATGGVTLGSGLPSGTGAGRSGSGEDLFVRTNTAFNGPVVTDGDYTDASNDASVVAANDYFEFTITPQAGYQIDIDTVSYKYTAVDVDVNKGPVSFFKSFLRSSEDSYANNLSAHTFTDIFGTVAADTGSSSQVTVSTALLNGTFDSVTGTTTFRIYFNDGVNAGSNQLLHRVDDIVIDGVVSTVPEPATLGLLLIGGLALLPPRRRAP